MRDEGSERPPPAYTPVVARKTDVLKSAAVIAAATLPAAAGPEGALMAPAAGGFLQWIFDQPWKDRTAAWLDEIESSLRRLEAQVSDFKLESLREDDRVLTLLAATSRAAVATHQKVKRDALRNLLINSILAPNPDEDLELSILAIVERLTPSHLAVLTGRTDRIVRPIQFSPAANQTVDEGNLDFIRFLSSDLRALGLTEKTSANSVRVTAMGSRVLRYIESPFDAVSPGEA